MADSFSAIADDVSAAYYNPAGLNQLSGTQLGGAHTAYFQGINYETLSLAVPFAKERDFSRHAVALGVYQLGVSDIERRTNDTPTPNGTFGASDAAYTLSYSYAADRRLSAGVTGKYITEKIDTYSAGAYALDAGVLYKPNPDGAHPMAVSAVVRNLGSRIGFFAGQTDPLPVSLTLGGSAWLSPKAFRANLELTKYRDEKLFLAAGGEWTHAFTEAVSGSLRAGYSSERSSIDGLTGITAGGGVTFRKASFDFAWIPFGVLGDTFRYSLVIKF